MKPNLIIEASPIRQKIAESQKAPILNTPKGVRKYLTYVVLFLTAAYVVTGLLNKILGVDNVFTEAMYYLFDMDGENNIPAAFSFLILLFAAGLLGITGTKTPIAADKKFWFILSFVFLFLGCDELMQIHEYISGFIKTNYANRIAGSDFVWVLPYGVFTLIFFILFLKFILRLPNPTRNLFFISGGIYVFSALGIDYVQGVIQRMSSNKIYYKLLTAIEEPGEMIGIILFIYAILNYLIFINKQIMKKVDSEFIPSAKNNFREAN